MFVCLGLERENSLRIHQEDKEGVTNHKSYETRIPERGEGFQVCPIIIQGAQHRVGSSHCTIKKHKYAFSGIF